MKFNKMKKLTKMQRNNLYKNSSKSKLKQRSKFKSSNKLKKLITKMNYLKIYKKSKRIKENSSKIIFYLMKNNKVIESRII